MLDSDDATRIKILLNDNFAPGAAYSVYQQVARAQQVERTTQTTGEFSVRFDSLRREAASKMQLGGAFPEICTPVHRMKNASPSRPEASLVLASLHEELENMCGCQTNASTFRTASWHSSTSCISGDGCGCEFGRRRFCCKGSVPYGEQTIMRGIWRLGGEKGKG